MKRVKSARTNLLAVLGLGILACGCRAGEAPETTVEAPVTSTNEQVQGRGEGKDRWWQKLPRAPWSGFEEVAQTKPALVRDLRDPSRSARCLRAGAVEGGEQSLPWFEGDLARCRPQRTACDGVHFKDRILLSERPYLVVCPVSTIPCARRQLDLCTAAS